MSHARGSLHIKGGIHQKPDQSIDWTKSGGVWACPDDADQPNNSGISITGNGDILGAGDLGNNPTHAPKSLAAIQRPSEVLFASDTNKPYFGGNVNQTGTDFIRVQQPGDYSADEASLTAARYVNKWFKQYDWTDLRDDPNNTASCTTGAWTCKYPSFRHNRSGKFTGIANVLFCDGHVKAEKWGQMSARNYLPMLPDDIAAKCDTDINCGP